MNTRPAPPPAKADFTDEPVTTADWAAMCAEEQAFLQEGNDALDRGEFVTNEEMQRHFDRLLDDIAKA